MKAHERMEKGIHFTIRTVQIQDVSFLWDMLYEAAAVSEGMRALGKRKALSLPVNRKYVEAYGRLGDAGVIAVDQMGRPLGAAWYRLHPEESPGYGFVSPTIPELTIGVRMHVVKESGKHCFKHSSRWLKARDTPHSVSLQIATTLHFICMNVLAFAVLRYQTRKILQ